MSGTTPTGLAIITGADSERDGEYTIRQVFFDYSANAVSTEYFGFDDVLATDLSDNSEIEEEEIVKREVDDIVGFFFQENADGETFPVIFDLSKVAAGHDPWITIGGGANGLLTIQHGGPGPCKYLSCGNVEGMDLDELGHIRRWFDADCGAFGTWFGPTV